jgi:hypothetical protein
VTEWAIQYPLPRLHRRTFAEGKRERVSRRMTEQRTPFTFTYKNYRGDIAVRNVTPISVRFGSTEWHPEPQWLLLAFDHEKQAEREFAMTDIGGAAQDARETRTGAYLLQIARAHGWPDDDGEGALEFMLRRCREVAIEDRGGLAQQPRTEGPFKDGDPIVAALIWEVDRAVKQALRDGGKYETTIRWILNEHLRGFAQTPMLPCPVCGGEAIHAIDTLKRVVIKPITEGDVVGLLLDAAEARGKSEGGDNR